MDLLKNNTLLLILAAIMLVTMPISLINSFIKKNYNKSKSYELETKKYIHLKKEDISAIPNAELAYAVMSWMWSKFNSGRSDELEVISSLPKPCQDIYSVYTIEAEVNNGGFNQCFFNSSRQFTKMAESGFKAMGAEGFADIMIRATLLYLEIKDDLEDYNDGFLKSFIKSYESNPLNALDDEFYNMYKKEPLDSIYIHYIRANSQYFGD